MLNNISLQIAGLVTEIETVKTELHDINSNMSGVFFELEQQRECIEHTVQKQNEYAHQIDLLTSATTKQERQIEGLQQLIEKIEINANKNNVMIYGIEEDKEEDCKQVVTNFIKVKMEAPEEVSILNKQGNKSCSLSQAGQYYRQSLPLPTCQKFKRQKE